LSVPFYASIPSGIEDIPPVGKHNFLGYMPKKIHASPSFNLPNYVASRQEKFQEFLCLRDTKFPPEKFERMMGVAAGNSEMPELKRIIYRTGHNSR